MRSSAYRPLPRGLKNPTILAMLSSLGFHGLLAIISVLNPVESQPNRLRIVNLAPANPASTNNNRISSPTTLPVPKGLPPINLGNVPQLSDSMSTSPFFAPNRSFTSGLSQSSIDIKKLRTADLPQRSFPITPRPDYSGITVPNGIPPLQQPDTAQIPDLRGEKFRPSGLGTVPSQLDVAQDPNVSPITPSAPLNNSDLVNVYAGQGNQPLSNSNDSKDPAASSSAASPNADSPGADNLNDPASPGLNGISSQAVAFGSKFSQCSEH
jgi:hypothetical protein